VTVHWTSTALGHVAAIHNYIAQSSPRYARRVVDRTVGRTQLLGQFPTLGATVDEYRDETIREVLEHPYRIIYKLLPDRIDILAVVHAAKRLPRSLGSN
jgi:toxin ParE1/3/4